MVKQIISRTFRSCCESNLLHHSLALSFVTLLNLLPAFIVSLSILKWMGGLEIIVGGKIESIVNQIFTLEAISMWVQEILKTSLMNFNANQFGIWATLILLLTVFLLFLKVQWVFDLTWQSDLPKPLGKKIGSFLILIFGFTLFFLSTVWLRQFFNQIHFEGKLLVLDTGVKGLVWMIPFITSMFIFTLMYKIFPHEKVKWKLALLSGAVAALSWELLKIFLAFYVNKLTNWHLLYGSLFVVPIFLFWIQMAWIIILMGFNFLKTLSRPLEN